jgi:hypothetical protein
MCDPFADNYRWTLTSRGWATAMGFTDDEQQALHIQCTDGLDETRRT